MLRNNLRIALRNLRKHPGHTAITVVGLAVGLAACVLIATYLRHEGAYDSFHTRADRIHQVLVKDADATGPFARMAPAPVPLPDLLRRQVAPVKHAVALNETGAVLKHADRAYPERILFADSTFFEVFSFPLRRGDPAAVLDAPDGVVLTPDKARQLFGTSDAVGRRLTLLLQDTPFEAVVTGIAEPPPEASSIDFGVVAPLARLANARGMYQNPSWGTLAGQLFVELHRADQAEAALAQMQAQVAARAPSDTWTTRRLDLLPLNEVHWTAGVYGQLTPPTRPLYAWLLAGIAGLILLLAGINFVSLAVGRSVQRACEVGVRKAVGATRTQVMAQFWAEAVLLTTAALVLGLALARAALPAFATLVDMPVHEAAFFTPTMLAVIGGLLLVTAGLAGSYPAVVLSRFSPTEVLRGRQAPGGPPRMVKGLVVLQFGLSIALVVGTVAMHRQLDLVLTKDLGFEDREHVVTLDASAVPTKRTDALLARLRAAANEATSVQSVTGTWQRVAVEGALPNRFPATSDGTTQRVHALTADYDVVETLGLRLTAGRSFSRDRPSDAEGKSVLVNRAFVEAFGWDAPLGNRVDVRWNVQDAAVVGVVENFHFQTLHTAIGPLVIHMSPRSPRVYALARLAPGRTGDGLERLRTAWEAVVPEYPFSPVFLDDVVQRQYAEQQRWTTLTTGAAAFALGIACLGLLGLAMLTVQRRIREIGIRKALGATSGAVVRHLSRDWVRLVAAAFVLAVPVAYLGLERWLSTFAYRIELTVGLFLIGGLVVALSALATVAVQALKAARLDPVDAIREE